MSDNIVAQNVWEPTAMRFVAFLDIMGFKDRVWRNLHEDVLRTMESLVLTVDAINQDYEANRTAARTGTPSPKSEMGRPIVKPVLFSDSLLLVSGDDLTPSAIILMLHIQSIMWEAMKNGVAVKGAIAHGKQTADPDHSLYFGRPLIDAYELQNEVLMYGVVMHHTAHNALADVRVNEKNNLQVFEEIDWVAKYKTPLKRGGSVIHHCVKWQSDHESEAEGVISKFYHSVSGEPRQYVDNTLEFLRSTRTQRPK